MNRSGRLLRLALALLPAGLMLAGCGTTPVRTQAQTPEMLPPVQGPSEPTPGQDGFPAPSTIPPDVTQTPDAVPRDEPRSASGNAPSYTVFGKTYHVLQSADGFEQVGYASWYGKKFQGKPTASGEPYNMFKMTAAHKRLPIPSYARVTDLENGRSVIVRVNDRGPFHSGRIIDLSYAAAARLGMLRKGSTRVRVEALAPDDDTQVASSKSAAPAQAHDSEQTTAGAQIPTAYHPGAGSLYLQVGVFTDPINAVALRDRLRQQGVAPLALQSDTYRDNPATRVLIGPFKNERARDAMRSQLQARQIAARPLERP